MTAAEASGTLAARGLAFRWDLAEHSGRAAEMARRSPGDDRFETVRSRGTEFDDESLTAFLLEPRA